MIDIIKELEIYINKLQKNNRIVLSLINTRIADLKTCKPENNDEEKEIVWRIAELNLVKSNILRIFDINE